MGKLLSLLAAAVLGLGLLTGCASGENAASSPSVESAKAPASVSASASAESPSASESGPPAASPSADNDEIASPSAGSEPSASAPEVSSSPSASEAPPKSESPPSAEAADTATIAIVGNAEWGTIVKAESVELKKGDTAAAVLKRIAKAHKLAFEIRGSGEFTYVEGIDGLYEFDDGPTSGWKFRVNGEVPDIGAGIYDLKPGDELEWFYASEDEAAREGKESP